MMYYDETILVKNNTNSSLVLSELNQSVKSFFKAVHKYENNTDELMNHYYNEQVALAYNEYNTIRKVGFLAGIFTYKFFGDSCNNNLFYDYLRICVWDNKKKVLA